MEYWKQTSLLKLTAARVFPQRYEDFGKWLIQDSFGHRWSSSQPVEGDPPQSALTFVC